MAAFDVGIEGAGREFDVVYEEELRIAVIHVKVDGSALSPHQRSALINRLDSVRQRLRKSGYRVACDPPIISDDLPLYRPQVRK
jgi:hypothetical protein